MMAWQPTNAALERAVVETQRIRASTKPQWSDAHGRLEAQGIQFRNAVLADWDAEGQHVMCGIIGTRDGRLFDFCVTYGYDISGRSLEEGVGWINSWREVAREKVGLTSAGYPNSWAQAAIIAQLVFELKSKKEA